MFALTTVHRSIFARLQFQLRDLFYIRRRYVDKQSMSPSELVREALAEVTSRGFCSNTHKPILGSCEDDESVLNAQHCTFKEFSVNLHRRHISRLVQFS